jgi:hypothetical protein
MTIEDLGQTLPNGLHDARIRSLSHDFESAIVKLEVEVLFGLPDDPPPERYRYRNGEILFHQVLFCSVEIPENERIIGHPESIWFVFDRISLGALPENIAKALPPEALCYSLYILEWESQIRIAAGAVSFSWSDSGKAAAAL